MENCVRELLYSKQILNFRNKLTLSALNILSCEMNLKAGRKRFIHSGLSYPVAIQVFDHPSRLGYFDARFLEIGIHKSLIHNMKEAEQILRHELCHYLVYIVHGPTAAAHGKEFKAMCAKYGYNHEISRARIPKPTVTQKQDSMAAKVEKLLSLAERANIHESQSALKKAALLMESYQVQPIGKTVVVLRTLSQNRHSAKLDVISRIVREFGVESIVNHTADGVVLELIGTQEGVHYADYIVHFLDKEMERLYHLAQKTNKKLKGIASKTAFFRGLCDGYLSTLPKGKELIPLVSSMVPYIYPSLRKSLSYVKGCKEGKRAGAKAGEGLNIRNPLGLAQIKALLCKK